MDNVVTVFPPPVPVAVPVGGAQELQEQVAALQSVVDDLVIETLDKEVA